MKEQMIGMSEIQKLIDERFGYVSDSDVAELLKGQPEKDRHLVGRKEMIRYFQYYAKDHEYGDNYDNYRIAIKNSNISTKGAKYSREDILKVIEDPKIKEKIERKLMAKTRQSPYGYPVPICIFHDYMQIQIEEWTSEDNKSYEELSGYTERQLELFSVPTELLVERKEDLQRRISDLQDELADIENELKTRGYK
ncbi:MAG: hypothetical protein K5770_15815 [Lachnospiraceae bacterium]|nr:hypothetical protein [Lachnospiraceae bacterium]